MADARPSIVTSLVERFDAKNREKLSEALRQALVSRREFMLPLSLDLHGESRFLTCRAFPECNPDGEVTGVFGILKDDTESHLAALESSEKAAELRKLATFDPLTNLINRREFQRNLRNSIRESLDDDQQLGLLLHF